MKLIHTKDYLLLIDEEGEINDGDYKFENGNIIRNIINPQIKTGNKIIAYCALIEDSKELDLPLLPNPFEAKPTEQIVAEFCRNSENIDYNRIQDKVHLAFLQEDMVLLYEQAQSKQFSLEDMKTFAKKCLIVANETEGIGRVDKFIDEMSESLSTQQLPKEFYSKRIAYRNDGCPFLEEEENKFYARDEHGWETLDLKDVIDFKYQTITNSEGKQQLIGTYKY